MTPSRDLADDVMDAEREVAANPTAPGPLFRLCCLMLSRGDPRAAAMLPDLERFAAFAPGWEQLGVALDRAGQPRAARVVHLRAAAGYRAAWRRAPAERRLLLAHAQCLRRGRRDADAQAAFAELTQADPTDAEAWFGLGLARQDAGDRPGAVAAFRQALACRPGWHEAALNLGIAAQETGDMEAALDAYACALRARPQALARIAQALSTQPVGRLWLHLERLRTTLVARA